MIDGPANQIYWAGWYEDVYAKTPTGWRFKSRVHVAGTKAGIPPHAAAMRQAWQRQATQYLEEGAGAETQSGPVARDPLKWLETKE